MILTKMLFFSFFRLFFFCHDQAKQGPDALQVPLRTRNSGATKTAYREQRGDNIDKNIAESCEAKDLFFGLFCCPPLPLSLSP